MGDEIPYKSMTITVNGINMITKEPMTEEIVLTPEDFVQAGTVFKAIKSIDFGDSYHWKVKIPRRHMRILKIIQRLLRRIM